MKNKTDSYGTPLPQSVSLRKGATPDEIGKASTVNTFLLAATVAMSRGLNVAYNPATKTDTITDLSGGQTTIEHG